MIKDQSEKELEIIKEKVEFLRSNPEELKRLLQKAGIYNEDGNLTEAFGGINLYNDC